MSAVVAPVPQLPRHLLGWLSFLWTQVLFAAAAATDIRVRRGSFALVVLLPAALLYPCRDFLLFEPDEGRYAQIPKEMLDRGDWVVPTLQGEPYLDKPPLMYWLVRLSYEMFGVSDTAARLVPAVCVHLTVLAVYLIGRRSVGERAALWAALLLSVAPGYISVARLLLLDGLLTFCITTSLLCGFEAVRTGRLRVGWWVTSAVASGLGFLTKGPISEILLFPPLIAFAGLNGASARVGWKYVILFAGIVLAVNLPWYVGIYQRQPEFLVYFFWEHNVMRFLRPFDHLQPVWYYVPILLGGFLPGVVIGATYLRSLAGGAGTVATRSQAGGFWLLTGLWCLLFFSLSGSKLPTYILPAIPPLCLALGDYVARSRWNRSLAPHGLIAVFVVLVALLHYGAVPWYARERSPVGRSDLVTNYVADPDVVVVTFPRNVDSVAFYAGRADFTKVRTKEMNELLVECHFRPRTVILFTHDSSLAGFRESMPASLRITESVSLRKSKGTTWLDRLVGSTTPWGLCDVAIIEPIVLQKRHPHDPRR